MAGNTVSFLDFNEIKAGGETHSKSKNNKQFDRISLLPKKKTAYFAGQI